MAKTRTSDESTTSSSEQDHVTDFERNKTYVLGKFLGKGAHAQVYTTNIGIERYALKIMRLDSAPRAWHKNVNKKKLKAVRLNQVLKEVEIHGLMQHQNIVRLYVHFQFETKFCMLMEYCNGLTLAQILKCARLDENQCRAILRQLINGLEYIHGLGIIHRDLKPANIYFTDRDLLKIGDFGLADKVGSGRRGICGTPNYISPEVLLEHGYTTAVDIWAVGCITYHMLAGKPPFEAETQNATYEYIRAHHYEPLTRRQAGAAVRHLINWMLAYLPEERPTASNIRKHGWMRSTSNLLNLPTKPLENNSNNHSSDNSTVTTTLAELKYERLFEKGCNSESSQETSFWNALLKKVPIKKTPTFHLVPSTLLNLRNKVSYLFRIKPNKETRLKETLAQILKSPGTGPLGLEITSKEIPIFVSKWIDYSNKFGFGYQLSDGTTGVILNDGTQIALDGAQLAVTFCANGESSAYPIHSLPRELKSKLALLKNFREYMEKNLCSGMEQHPSSNSIPSIIHSWRRNENAVMFQGSDILQINFIDDHWKFIIFAQLKVHPHGIIHFTYNDNMEKIYYMVTIDNHKTARRYNLMEIKDIGCPESILNHLMYIYSIL